MRMFVPVILAVAILGIFFTVFKGNGLQMNENREITSEELATHATREDCWLAIEGTVYDVTKFIPMHPGKDNIVIGCGKDATALFANHGREGGVPHSERARQMLLKLTKKGTLKS